MAYRGPTQDEVDADMDSEAAIRLAEAGGDIMQVSMPIGANVAQWNVALARAAESLGQAADSVLHSILARVLSPKTEGKL